jgi:hypothetical protein
LLWLDRKYLMMVTSYLRNFKQKDQNLWNFSCPYCGDSQRNKLKARGYIYTKTNSYFFRCHNCNKGTTFFRFLEFLDKDLAEQYQFESYEQTGKKSHHPVPDPNFAELFKAPDFSRASKPENQTLLDELLDRVNLLEHNHPARIFLRHRCVPSNQFHKIYYLDDTRKIGQLSAKYKDKITSREPRIVFPCFDKAGKLTSLAARSINEQGMRYINVRISESDKAIFGLLDVDYNQHILVVEGAIDSLFLSNAVAVSGSSLGVGNLPFPKASCTLVFDNEPRNKDILKIMHKAIANGFQICIWPDTIKQKDINDMVIAGIAPDEIEQIIHENTVSGLKATMKFNFWKRG